MSERNGRSADRDRDRDGDRAESAPAPSAAPDPRRFRTSFSEFTDEYGSVAVVDAPDERDAWLLSSHYVPIER